MKLILTTTALVLCTTGVMAQGFSGGSVGLSYSGFTDEDDADFNTTKFNAAAEFAITNEISVAGDLTVRQADAVDDSLTGFFVHGIYGVGPDVDLGVFAGRESIQDIDLEVDTYGGEIAYRSGPVETEGYIGVSSILDADVTIFGAAASYGLGNGFSVTGAFDRADVNDEDIAFTTLEIGTEYALGNGAELYANLGNIQFDFGGASNDTNTFRIGANFNFGPDGGTTFDRRSFFDTYPIFGL